jgi:hypothetical protein
MPATTRSRIVHRIRLGRVVHRATLTRVTHLRTEFLRCNVLEGGKPGCVCSVYNAQCCQDQLWAALSSATPRSRDHRMARDDEDARKPQGYISKRTHRVVLQDVGHYTNDATGMSRYRELIASSCHHRRRGFRDRYP